MLVLSRKIRAGEKVMIGDTIVVHVLDRRGDDVQIGIEAPPDVHILRAELVGKGGHPKHPEAPKA